MRRVLVTGASGFVGRQTLEPLLTRGYEVHGAVRRPIEAANVTWHAADLLAPGLAEALVREVRPTHLLHLAWYAEHHAYWTAPQNLDWVGASLRLVRAFAEQGGTRAVLAGTCAEYDWTQGVCVEGATPIRPRGLYGVAKDAVRRVVEAFAAGAGLSAAWGRIFFLYGPYEHPGRLVASVARALLHGDLAETTAGTQVRDFLHVTDAGSAFAAVLDSPVEGAVNIASGEAYAVRDVVATIAGAVGRPELLRIGGRPTPSDEAPLVVGDVRTLRDVVGWRPAFSLEEGIAHAVAWWAANGESETVAANRK